MKINIGKLLNAILAIAAPIVAPLAGAAVSNAISKAGDNAKKPQAGAAKLPEGS